MRDVNRRFHGVFIGINNYQDPRIRSLGYAVADAKGFYEMESGIFTEGESNLRLILDREATRKEIIKTIGEELPRLARKQDLVLIYFAGHGSPETEGSIDRVSRYIIAYDTEFDNIFATAIDMERELVHIIERIGSDLVIVILDTCFSGRAGGRTFEGPVLSRCRGSLRKQFKLAVLKLGEGRAILSACGDNELAEEDSALQHGVFTFHLLKTLGSTTANSSVSLNELYDKVSHDVHDYTRGRQTPVLNGRISMARLPVLKTI
jgi:uncharacterized caspase-like protein